MEQGNIRFRYNSMLNRASRTFRVDLTVIILLASDNDKRVHKRNAQLCRVLSESKANIRNIQTTRIVIYFGFV